MDWEDKQSLRHIWYQFPTLGSWLVCAGTIVYGMVHAMFFYNNWDPTGLNLGFIIAAIVLCIPAIPTALTFLYFSIEGLIVGVVFGMTPHQRLREKVRAIGPASFRDLTNRFGRHKEDRILWALTDIRQGTKPSTFLGRMATRLLWLAGYVFCYGYPVLYVSYMSFRYIHGHSIFDDQESVHAFILLMYLGPLQFPGLILILREVWGVRKAHTYADAVLKEQRAARQQSVA